MNRLILPRRTLLAGAGLLASPGLLRAQGAWPDRPVRLVVPFTPGGSTDILARAMGAELQEALGQPFVVENRPGAGGTLGSELVARAAPDGYTLMMGHIGTLAVNPSLYRNLSYDTVTSFAPIVLVANVANILAVNPRKLPITSAQELIARARANPGAISYGSGGNGSAAHTAVVAFCLATGIELLHVPYRGTGPMMNDLIAGQIDMTMTGGPPILPPVRAGLLRALGVSSLQRLSSEPGIPTLDEQGVAGFDAVQWYGLVAPAGTPQAIIDKVNAASAAALRGDKLKPRLAAEGADAAPGTPEQFRQLIIAERARWGEVIRRANVTND
ncbi:Bug family tripartite tricarboxylate transporter substrate binding protein [Falsiroseomonas selenitidurans]|uniref:Tripartite tricarboxylate transporter substrate binding protein n=1 Tax=Falsiroseomonas selenitidurans TaxID=2716335 RepID=A0ABX1DZR4_9PROT|nr:tripartite tricarboxylate transporter substrate binding protein [Falsiroseomonas selenitidurans]NKC29865.1 tripartite tricarboxylate transporter substrate binding protein [Falsiroseomonas selenitidurans]